MEWFSIPPKPGARKPCPLLGLPYELRLRIYELLLTINDDMRPTTIAYSPSRWIQGTGRLCGVLFDRPTRKTEGGPLELDPWGNPSPASKHLHTAVLRTCRQIYCEAAPVLYGTNRFNFLRPNDLLALLNIASPVSAAGLHFLNLVIRC